MNVFVLTTGRTGSTTLSKACSHISNFTSGHETLCKEIADKRLDYPLNHIEIDNRLSFYLGSLDKKYGDNAFYVHLNRLENKVSTSFNKRWFGDCSIIRAFAESIKFLSIDSLSNEEKNIICKEYVKITNDNIDFFLKDKSNVLRIDIDKMDSDFIKFWNFIKAKGKYEDALNEFNVIYNATTKVSNSKKNVTSSNFIIKIINRIFSFKK